MTKIYQEGDTTCYAVVRIPGLPGNWAEQVVEVQHVASGRQQIKPITAQHHLRILITAGHDPSDYAAISNSIVPLADVPDLEAAAQRYVSARAARLAQCAKLSAAYEARREKMRQMGLTMRIKSRSKNSATVSVSDMLGHSLDFSCRNIMDFGYVINPCYSIAPGLEPGGACNIDDDGQPYWMDFSADDGWEHMRYLTPLEDACIVLLTDSPPIMSDIRMYDGEGDVVIEPDLEWACEQGLIAGAMPADI